MSDGYDLKAIRALWRRFAAFMAQDSATAGSKGNALRFISDPDDSEELSGWVVRMREGREVMRATVAAGHGIGPGGEPVLIIRRVEIKPGPPNTSGDVSQFVGYLDAAWWSAIEAESSHDDKDAFGDSEYDAMRVPHPPEGHGVLSDHVAALTAHAEAFPLQGHDVVLRIAAVDLKTLDFAAGMALADLIEFSGGQARTRSGLGTQARWYLTYEPRPWRGDYEVPDEPQP